MVVPSCIGHRSQHERTPLASMRKPRVFSHEKVMPRMSWSVRNLYNTIARSTVPFHSNQLSFQKTSMTMYQQRWRSKRFLRSYHGDWISEKRFKRQFLPKELPRFQPPQVAAGSVSTLSPGPRRGGAFDNMLKARHSSTPSPSDEPSDSYSSVTPHTTSADMEAMPTTSLFMADVERRIDTAVFRCCFARSAYEARALVVQGKVKLNGVKCNNPNQLLNPGDMISIMPSAVPMLSDRLAKAVAKERANDIVGGRPKETTIDNTAADTEAAAEEDSSEAAATSAPDQSHETEEASSSSDADKTMKGDAETESATNADELKSETMSQDDSAKSSSAKRIPASERGPKEKVLPPGVLPFTLPLYAAPFLFIPSYLEVSFTTCSAIYVRHPTIVPHAVKNPDGSSKWLFRTDLPSPYPAGGELYTMGWEHYTRNSPRVRADERRLKLEARFGRNGFLTQRAKDLKQKQSALQRGWGRTKAATVWRDQLIAAHAHEHRGRNSAGRARRSSSATA